MRLGKGAFSRDDVLAIGGIPLAGDALDASIMRSHVAKHFGADTCGPKVRDRRKKADSCRSCNSRRGRSHSCIASAARNAGRTSR